MPKNHKGTSVEKIRKKSHSAEKTAKRLSSTFASIKNWFSAGLETTYSCVSNPVTSPQNVRQPLKITTFSYQKEPLKQPIMNNTTIWSRQSVESHRCKVLHAIHQTNYDNVISYVHGASCQYLISCFLSFSLHFPRRRCFEVHKQAC